jgi:hypothetical protein
MRGRRVRGLLVLMLSISVAGVAYGQMHSGVHPVPAVVK